MYANFRHFGGHFEIMQIMMQLKYSLIHDDFKNI